VILLYVYLLSIAIFYLCFAVLNQEVSRKIKERNLPKANKSFNAKLILQLFIISIIPLINILVCMTILFSTKTTDAAINKAIAERYKQ